jgi:hypothetical protein
MGENIFAFRKPPQPYLAGDQSRAGLIPAWNTVREAREDLVMSA